MGTGIDMNRGTDHVVLNKETSPEIFTKIRKESAVMRLARKVTLPGPGIDFQLITSDPSANWVGETNPKPVSTAVLNQKTMKGYTCAVFLPVSKQLARDKASLVAEMVRSLPLALGKKFDETVFTKTAVPGSDFDSFASVTNNVNIATSTYDALVEAETKIGNEGWLPTNYLFAPQAKKCLLQAKDGKQRPLFIDNLRNEGTETLGHILGTPTYFNKHVYKAGTASPAAPEQLGILGQWDKALWGMVESIELRRFDQASLTIGGQLVSLPERNMVAYRCEMEVGFVIIEPEAFCMLKGATPTAANEKGKK